MVRFDGKTDNDIRLWHTYVFLAREPVKSLFAAQPHGKKPAIADDPTNRVKESIAKALQTILFSSFTLEYRMRRVLDELGVILRPNTTLTPLLKNFWIRLAAVDRLDKKGKCLPPPDWRNCESDLKRLVQLRNDIVHADYKDTLRAFSNHGSPESLACQLYNSVVEAIKLINVGTGYDLRSRQHIDTYFDELKVPRYVKGHN